MGTLKQAVDRVAAAKTAIGAAITSKGGTVAAGDGLEDFAADIATITNQYTQTDEGKVVSGGALVAQTAYPSEITANNTYDTTNYNSVTVNVSASSSSGCAELYDSSAYTTKVQLCLAIINGKAILSGVITVSSTAVNYYINPNELKLSDFFNVNEKIITGDGLGSGGTGYYSMQCTLNVGQNSISIKTNTYVSSRIFYIYLDTQ